MLVKQFALNPVSPLFKCLHRVTSIKKLTLAHATKKISQSNWGNAIHAGRPSGVVDDVALFSSLQTSPWVWRLKAWGSVFSIEYIQRRKPGVYNADLFLSHSFTKGYVNIENPFRLSKLLSSLRRHIIITSASILFFREFWNFFWFLLYYNFAFGNNELVTYIPKYTSIKRCLKLFSSFPN